MAWVAGGSAGVAGIRRQPAPYLTGSAGSGYNAESTLERPPSGLRPPASTPPLSGAFTP